LLQSLCNGFWHVAADRGGRKWRQAPETFVPAAGSCAVP
jgi:hypothetical protein